MLITLALVALSTPQLESVSSLNAPPQDSRPAKEDKEEAKKDEKTPKPLPNAKDGDDPALKEMAKFIDKAKINKKSDRWKTQLPKPPKLTFSEDKEYHWNLRTNKGDITIRLFKDVAPMHVSSTIYLTRVGFYDGIVFHRVIPKFMAQGGCPAGRGTGGPGYSYDGEFDPKVKHDRPGLLSMAHRGPGTDGSQFFLTFVPTPHLDNRHTIFGEIIEGMDTLESLEKQGSASGKTKERLEILEATISVHDKPKKDEKAEDAKAGDE